MNQQLYNIVRSFKREKTIIHRNVSAGFVKETLPNLKRRARDNHSNVYFDAEPVPADLAASVVTNA